MTTTALAPFRIPAEVHDDASTQQVRFDAARYFDQVSDRTLVRLITSPPSYDYDTDAIAEFLASHLPEVQRFFDTKPDRQFNGDTNGFGVSYEADALKRFALETRPHLADAIRRGQEGELEEEEDYQFLSDAPHTPRTATRRHLLIRASVDAGVDQEVLTEGLRALGLDAMTVQFFKA